MENFYRSLSSQQLNGPSAGCRNNGNSMVSGHELNGANVFRAHAQQISDMLTSKLSLPSMQQQQMVKQLSPSATLMLPSNGNQPNFLQRRRRSISANNNNNGLPLFSEQDHLNQPIPVDISGQKVVGFNVGGEPRLCLPHLLSTVFKPVPLQLIYKACSDLHVYFSSATPSQLRVLFTLGALRESTQTCGLITRTQTERLCSVLHPPPPTASTTCQFLSTYAAQIAAAQSYNKHSALSLQQIIPVQHRCFGKCRGRAYADLYVNDDAACIQCDQCSTLLTPRAFVLHSHSKKRPVKAGSAAGTSELLATALAGGFIAAVDATTDQFPPEVINTCHWGFNADKWRQYLHCFCRLDEQPNKRAHLEVAWEHFKQKFQTPPSPTTASTNDPQPPAGLSLTTEQLQQLARMQQATAGANTTATTASLTASNPAEFNESAENALYANLENLQNFIKPQFQQPPNIVDLEGSKHDATPPAMLSTLSSVQDAEHQAALAHHLKLGVTEIIACLASQNRLTPELYQSLLNIVARPDLIPSSLLSELAAQLGVISPLMDRTVIPQTNVVTAKQEEFSTIPEMQSTALTAAAAASSQQQQLPNLVLTPPDSNIGQEQQQSQAPQYVQQLSASTIDSSSAVTQTHDELIRKLSTRLTDSLTQLEKLKPKLPAIVRESFSSAVEELNATYKDAFEQQAKVVDDLEMQLAAIKLQSIPSSKDVASPLLPPNDQQAVLLSRALEQRDAIIKSLNEQILSHGKRDPSPVEIDTAAAVPASSASSSTNLIAHLQEMIAARDEKIVQLERQVELLENKLTSVSTLNENSTSQTPVRPTDAYGGEADGNSLPSMPITNHAEKCSDKSESSCRLNAVKMPSTSISQPTSTTARSPPTPISFVPCASAMSRQKVRRLRGSFSTSSLRGLRTNEADDTVVKISAPSSRSADDDDENIVDLQSPSSLRKTVTIKSAEEQKHDRRGSLQIFNNQQDPRSPPKRTHEECSNDDADDIDDNYAVTKNSSQAATDVLQK